MNSTKEIMKLFDGKRRFKIPLRITNISRLESEEAYRLLPVLNSVVSEEIRVKMEYRCKWYPLRKPDERLIRDVRRLLKMQFANIIFEN
jgi:hypothetical protein